MSRITDPLMWGFCWLVFRLVMVLPITSKLWGWLLPYAGFYAYHTPDVPWRWSERNR